MSWVVGVSVELLVGHSYSVAAKAAYVRTRKIHAAHGFKLVIVLAFAHVAIHTQQASRGFVLTA